MQLTPLTLAARLRIGAGVQLDGGRSCAHGRLDLLPVRVDKEGYADSVLVKPLAHGPECTLLPRHVETALGRDFLSTLRHQAAILGPHLTGDPDHLFACGHLQVEPRLQRVPAQAHIPILDMTSVLAQMHRDAVRAGLLRDQRCKQRIRIGRASRLPEGGDVIDVEAEMDGHEKRLVTGES